MVAVCKGVRTVIGDFFESAFPLAAETGLSLPGDLLCRATLLPRCGTPPMGDGLLLGLRELRDRKEPALEVRGEVLRDWAVDWLREGAVEGWREERVEFWPEVVVVRGGECWRGGDTRRDGVADCGRGVVDFDPSGEALAVERSAQGERDDW